METTVKKPGYEAGLKDYVDSEKAAVDLMNSVGRLMYDRGVELVFFRNHLLDISISEVIKLFDYAEQVVNAADRCVHHGGRGARPARTGPGTEQDRYRAFVLRIQNFRRNVRERLPDHASQWIHRSGQAHVPPTGRGAVRLRPDRAHRSA